MLLTSTLFNACRVCFFFVRESWIMREKIMEKVNLVPTLISYIAMFEIAIFGRKILIYFCSYFFSFFLLFFANIRYFYAVSNSSIGFRIPLHIRTLSSFHLHFHQFYFLWIFALGFIVRSLLISIFFHSI